MSSNKSVISRRALIVGVATAGGAVAAPAMAQRVLLLGGGTQISGNLVRNGTFNNDDGSWSKGTGITISGGLLNLAAGSGNAEQNITTITNHLYRVRATSFIQSVFCGAWDNPGGSGNLSNSASARGVGIFEYFFKAADASSYVLFTAGGAGACSVDNVSAIDRGTGLAAIICNGDSITLGQNSWPSYPSVLSDSTLRAVLNLGVSGQTLATMDTNYAASPALYFSSLNANTLIVLGGTNDLLAHATEASLETHILSYCGKARTTGYRVFVGTVLPSTGIIGTDETSRQTFNAYLRANWASFADGLVDFDAIPEAAQPTNTLFYLDGTHPTATLNALMAGKARLVL